MSDADAVAAWRREHASALADLQDAQRAYHRAVAAAAFPDATEAPSAEEMRRASLEALDAARIRLDEVRARRPVIREEP